MSFHSVIPVSMGIPKILMTTGVWTRRARKRLLVGLAFAFVGAEPTEPEPAAKLPPVRQSKPTIVDNRSMR